MIRTIAIWVFGLLAGAIIGGVIVNYLLPYSSDAVLYGPVGGMCVFACARLWLAQPRT